MLLDGTEVRVNEKRQQYLKLKKDKNDKEKNI